MSLYDELKRFWRPPALVTPARSHIERAEKEAAELFGPLRPDPEPPRNYLEEAERLLIAGKGDLGQLERLQLKAIPWVLWSSEHKWSERRYLVEDYLAWADDKWRSSPRRLWRHYLLNLDPESVATQILARWLKGKRERLGELLWGFSERWRLFDPPSAIRTTAEALIEGRDLANELEHLKFARREVLSSSLMLRVLSRVGQTLKTQPPHSAKVARVLKSILTPLGEGPMAQMQGRHELRQEALGSLAAGVVRWAVAGGYADEALELLLYLADDPRLHPGRWTGIDQKTREIVESWLTKVTLDAFFRVMLQLKTGRDDMVREREAFWRSYHHQNAISRAWLIVAKKGAPIAQTTLGQSFGLFVGGRGVVSDHCGLMMQIGNLVILEMNKVGSTFFWMAGDSQMPPLFQPEYDRQGILRLVEASSNRRFSLPHPRNIWQDHHAEKIKEWTGVTRSEG